VFRPEDKRRSSCRRVTHTYPDINGNSGPQTVTEGTDAIVTLATEGPGHGSGRFVDRHGEIAWS
jgi:hypothetical protein